MRITNVILNEKGNVKADARKIIATYVNENRDVFAKAIRNDNGTYSIPMQDSQGNIAFINFEVTISNKCAGDRKPKATTKVKVEAETFDIAD